MRPLPARRSGWGPPPGQARDLVVRGWLARSTTTEGPCKSGCGIAVGEELVVGVGFAEWYNWSSERDERLATLFYRHVDPSEVEGRDPEAIVGAVTHLVDVAHEREPSTAVISVTNPTRAENGWTCGRTVVSIVTDDMPFLVDSVSAELNRVGAGIHLLVHPTVTVARDGAGRLVTAEPPSDATVAQSPLPPPAVTRSEESWMHFEVAWQHDATALAVIEQNLHSVLGDVRRAVRDWPRMVAEARGLATGLVAEPPRGIDAAEVDEVVGLLKWLANDHFTFLGYRKYRLVAEPGDPDELALVEEAGSGLGLLRSERPESASFAELPRVVRQKARERRLLIVTKANRRSTVHRPSYLDYVGVKVFDAAGQVVGEHRFIGLLASSAYTQSVEGIPVIDRKVRRVRSTLGVSRASHRGRGLMAFLETFPRDELFAIDADELATIAEAALNLEERRATRLFLRRDAYERFLSCLVYLPRDRYTTQVRRGIQDELMAAIGGAGIDFSARVSESVLARLHLVVRMPRGQSVPEVDADALERRLAAVVQSWEDELLDRLVAASSEPEAHDLLQRYIEGFPQAYRAVTPPVEAVDDLAEIEQLSPGVPLRVSLRSATEASGKGANARLKLYATRDIALAEVLPVLSSLGVRVVTEHPFRLTRTDVPGVSDGAFIFDFGLQTSSGARLDGVRRKWEQAFIACWDGLAEADGLNGLVASADVDWPRIAVLRAYTLYLRQAGSTFSTSYIESALLANPGIARLLVQLFLVRFDPDQAGDRSAAAAEVRAQVVRALDDVDSLDQDRIVRLFLDLIGATLRTNYFRPDRVALALKLEPSAIRELPEPRPAFEIWVCAPQVEGVHLRFGTVARGGLRWSDRREDFRTEILGLVKAQAVKNAVIVPVGAKGGFFPKQLPDPADREAWWVEGARAYRHFVSSLLDVTDNLVGEETVPPPHVVRHDGDDPYLVVAADKGTATFSDVANDVAAEHGFWLGDAFASGGSVGYDHKAMGITARGAWESVKAHFRVIGPDISAQTFTAVGIGDMSGDVFGNGMLLSKHLRLVAAFDHRHILLDPDPDPEVSFAERQRLFALSRSSWADYSAAAISPGGGVFRRTAKSVDVSEQAAAALGLSGGAQSLVPNDVLRAILQAPVDLLWNGGIGTYVKATGESDADVGDRANDAVRINGSDLRARVVAEGGNLGLTQLGRIEAARAGVLLNTDAIDNSAGVDTSDHEVNIKVLLARAEAAGALDPDQREPLLESMTHDVARRVLAHNIGQNILLNSEVEHSSSLTPALGRLMRALERSAGLDRALEALPDRSGMQALLAQGGGLTRPELCVLIAHTKLDLKADIARSAVPDEAFADAWLHAYFPESLTERFGDQVAAHPLRRQIIATTMVNELVNRGGTTYAMRAAEETGAGPAEIVRAFAVTSAVFSLPDLWARIDAHEGQAPTGALNALRSEVQRLLDRSTRWFLHTRGGTLDVPQEVERFRRPVTGLAATVSDLLIGVERQRLERRVARFMDAGAPAELAAEVATMLDQYCLLDIVEVARRTGESPASVARLYFTTSERYEVDSFLSAISALPRTDRWSSLARAALRSDLYAALASLTSQVVRSTDATDAPQARLATWEQRHAEGWGRSRGTLAEILDLEEQDLATLSVALRAFRTLALQGG